MSDWVLVPCLQTLRHEFDVVSPGRDRGADGSIGDSNHTSSSDHTPDEDSDVLRNRDSDNKNEVHALDIDSSGPWPTDTWFDDTIRRIVERHRTGQDKRLRYVIWNRQIAGVTSGWKWVKYTATSDPHINHAHCSSVYTSKEEADISPWGVSTKDGDMELSDKMQLTQGAKDELGGDYAKAGELTVQTALNLLLIQATRSGKNSGEILKRFAPIVDTTASVEKRGAALEELLGEDSVKICQWVLGISTTK
jgi:hypothetical protein